MRRICDLVGVVMIGVVAVCVVAPYAAAEWLVFKLRGWCYPYCKVVLKRKVTERAGVPVTVMKCANCHRVIEF